MSEIVLCLLDTIDANPYQVRTQEDPQAVRQLADSILRNGLLQVPTARKLDGRIQLAFGHTRLAAFHLLVKADEKYQSMPLNLVPLTDEQMFEAAVAENIARRDLTPIELARAMRRYIDGFQKTSVETGKFFNVSPETVRGTVRLLALPEEAQEQVAKGALSIGDARKVLTAQQAVPKVGVKLAKALAASKEPDQVDVEGLLSSEVRRAGVEMWRNRRPGEGRGGEGLWPFTWTGVPPLQADQIEFAKGPEALAAAHHLQHIPPCTTCEYHTSLDETEYCLLKTCWEHKRETWLKLQLEQISKRLKIAAYLPTDPKQFLGWDENYNSRLDAHFRPKVGKNSPDLRVLQLKEPHYSDYPGTESPYFMIVDISRTKAPVKRTGQTKAHDEKMQNRRLARAFLRRVAAPAFAQIFDRVGNLGAMSALVRRADYEVAQSLKSKEFEKLTKARQRVYLAACLAQISLEEVIPREWNVSSPYNSGAMATARFLTKVARTWGVKLPADWKRQAKAFRLAKESEG